MLKNEIIKAEDVKELEEININSKLLKIGMDIIKSTFNYKQLKKELANNIFITEVNIYTNHDLRAITIKKSIEIYINKDLKIIYSYIKTGASWAELDKEQAKAVLNDLYLFLGAEKINRLKTNNIEGKYNLIGYLLKYKFNYKSFVSYEKTINNYICFNFINKEGYKRSWQTTKSRIAEYFNYTNTDIIKTLFK